jgi:hypothetical protein
VEPGEKIVLDGSGSKDKENDPLEFEWQQVGGPKAEFPFGSERRMKLDVTLPAEGEYVFQLKVKDGKLWSEPARVAVKTRAGNRPPEARVANAAVRVEVEQEAVLDASASSDPDTGPGPLTFSWKQTGGPRLVLNEDGPRARVRASREGTFTFELTVSDGRALSAPAKITLTVVRPGLLPVAVADANPKDVGMAKKNDPKDPNLVILDGRKSRSVTGEIKYAWKQVEGRRLDIPATELAKPRIGLLFFQPGTYRFELTVSDGQETSQPSYVEVRVRDDAAAPEAPKRVNALPETPVAPLAAAPPRAEAPRAAEAESEDGGLLPPPKESRELFGLDTEELKRFDALAQESGTEAEEKLVALLNSENEGQRSAAADALFRRGLNAVPALIDALETATPAGRTKAHWALCRLTREKLSSDPAKWKQWWAAQPVARREN